MPCIVPSWHSGRPMGNRAIRRDWRGPAKRGMMGGMSRISRAVSVVVASMVALSCRMEAMDLEGPPEPLVPATDTPAKSEPPPTSPMAETSAPKTETPPAAKRPPRQPAAPKPAPAKAGDPEAGRLVGITAAHNRVREPLGIGPLVWAPELARFAQAWADKLERQGCGLQHRPHKGPDTQKYGENIYSASGSTPGVGEVVDTWVEERKDYNAKANRCKGVCGHYTQVVWRKSQRLGCGMAACGGTEVWVCNYDPPGNFLGERPY
jgi:pathogenesis-related protein 1